ncbi:MAG TPA: beta-galactosidase [Armatimonadota bacterium]|nr:beta-galactosidase [Armatimonadota bacterium]
MRYFLLIGLLMIGGAARSAPLTLLPNQDFEDAQLGWSLWPTESQSRLEIDREVVRNGRQSLRVTAVRSSDRAFAVIATPNFEHEVVYRISVAIRKDASVPDSAISYAINYRGGDNNAILQRARPTQLRRVPEGEWVRWSGLFMTPKGVREWQFLLGVEYAVGRVWFDDIRIERLGPASELNPDVWTNLTVGVEIGSGPLQRFTKHKEENNTIYRMSKRYNDLLLRSAFAEAELRELERCLHYAGKPGPARARRLFEATEARLNEAFLAYGTAFRSGKEGEWAAFEKSAAALEKALADLEAGVAREKAEVRPAKPPALPKWLGRQSRDIAPIRPDGRMNRLLFGVWSPTAFAEYERPFDLEFHSSAPGAPKVHTETEIDFSNITAACDSLEAQGYPSTFSYLMFGIHEYLYAPKWLVEKYRDEPDFFKVSWDGLKGGSRGNEHSLNWFHPAVREYIRDYLTRYATFCKNEPRILFHEVAQEAYPDFTTSKGRRETGYGPHAVQAFRAYLKARYPSIEALNRAWGTKYAGFDSIEPPPDAYAQRGREATPLVAEFEAFRDDAYIDYLKLIYDSLKAGDPNKPVVARHSGLLSAINGARIFETCDVLSYHRGAPQMQLMNLYLNSLNRYHRRGLGYMEDFWGLQDPRADDEVVQRRSLERHIAEECIWGRSLQMKWYSYTTGAYIFTYNGNWMNPRYDVTTMRYCAPALAVAKQKMEKLDWALTHSEIPPQRVLVLQPSASMRNERPEQGVFAEILGIHRLLYGNGILYELLPEEYFLNGRARLAEFDVVILPKARYLAADLQQALAKYVRDGGLLIACGEPGTHDELARPSGTLVRAVREASQQADWAKVEAAWQAAGPAAPETPMAIARCGQGEWVACASMAGVAVENGGKALLERITRRTKREAWPVAGRLIVVPRVTEDGGRTLFLLNPDLDAPVEEQVRVARAANRAVDLTVDGGYPIALKRDGEGVSFTVRLGPGESTAVWLE